MRKGFLLSALLSFVISRGTEVTVDPSFRPPIFEKFAPVNLAVTAVEGKVFIAGPFTSVGSFARRHLARVLSDGRPDLSFDAGRIEEVDGLLPLPDGRLMFGGTIAQTNGTVRAGVFRLLRNGAIDRSFNAVLPGDSPGYRMARTCDGKIYVQIEPAPRIVRLNLDGTIDPTFQIGFGFDDTLYSIVVKPNGKILVGGLFNQFDGNDSPKLARLNPNGSLDRSFRVELAFSWDELVTSIVLRGDGKILVGGNLETVPWRDRLAPWDDTRARLVALLNPDGSRVKSFNALGGVQDTVEQIVPLGNGDLVLGGGFYLINEWWSPGMAFLHGNGQVFGVFRSGSYGHSISGFDRNRFLVAGIPPEDLGPTRVRRMDLNKRVDAFRVQTGTNAIPNLLSQSADGKILASGGFQLVNGVQTLGAVRLNTNGARDVSFNIAKWPDGPINCMVGLTNGQILVGGRFTNFNGHAAVSVCRLTSEGKFAGTMKTPFWLPPPPDTGQPNGGFGPFPEIDQFVRTQDGQILGIGSFNSFEGRVMRFRGDGQEDPAFNVSFHLPGEFLPFVPDSILSLRDGSYLMAGVLEECFEDCEFGGYVLARVDSTGALDSTFEVGRDRSPDGRGWKTVIEQSDGKCLVTRIGWPAGRIVRILRNGKEDDTFRSVDIYGDIYKALSLADDSTLIAGDFETVDGKRRPWLARILKDGGVDESFNAGDAFDGAIGDLLPQKDGGWIVHGRFEHVNGAAHPGLARVR